MAATLYYFPIAGRGELIRLVAAAGGVELVEGGDGGSLDKSEFGSPGSTPLLHHGDLKMSQSGAIEQYMSLLAFPDLTPPQRAKDFQFAGIKEDFGAANAAIYFGPKKAQADVEVAKVIAKWFPVLEALLPTEGFVNGKSYPTMADLVIVNVVTAHIWGALSIRYAGVKMERDYPKMAALALRAGQSPKVQAYIARSFSINTDFLGFGSMSFAPAIAEALQVKDEYVGQADVGIIGLATMGANLCLNILDKGFKLAVYNRTALTSQKFVEENRPKYGADKVFGAANFEDFAKLLKKPRRALILVVAGPITDGVIENLSRVFEKNDIIVDTGNAHFKDQTGRANMLEAKGLRFLGMGVSGGAEGARKGPAFFPGGTMSIWDEIKPVVEAASAKAADGRPCVTMCGTGGAGSCVKMYHNAGEYAILQLWGEVYAAMRNQGMTGSEIHEKLKTWKARGDLDSYMLDITIEVAGHKNAESPTGFLVDVTGDAIGSKGTGLWSVQVAMEVGCPVPSLAAAVVSRQMSMEHAQRRLNTAIIGEKTHQNARLPLCPDVDKDKFCEDLYWAAYLGIVASYAQMFEAIRAVDREYKLQIIGNLPRIISTFRAGCILQGTMLQPMTEAFEKNPNIPNLMCAFKQQLETGIPGFRATAARLACSGESAPVLQASLAYVTTMTQTVVLAGQCVSLQRDVFGRHGFKKIINGALTEESFNEDWPVMQP